jgi:hypothetical protein
MRYWFIHCTKTKRFHKYQLYLFVLTTIIYVFHFIENEKFFKVYDLL